MANVTAIRVDLPVMPRQTALVTMVGVLTPVSASITQSGSHTTKPNVPVSTTKPKAP